MSRLVVEKYRIFCKKKKQKKSTVFFIDRFFLFWPKRSNRTYGQGKKRINSFENNVTDKWKTFGLYYANLIPHALDNAAHDP